MFMTMDERVRLRILDEENKREDKSFEFFLSLLNDVSKEYKTSEENASEIRSKVMERIMMNMSTNESEHHF